MLSMQESQSKSLRPITALDHSSWELDVIILV